MTDLVIQTVFKQSLQNMNMTSTAMPAASGVQLPCAVALKPEGVSSVGKHETSHSTLVM